MKILKDINTLPMQQMSCLDVGLARQRPRVPQVSVDIYIQCVYASIFQGKIFCTQISYSSFNLKIRLLLLLCIHTQSRVLYLHIYTAIYKYNIVFVVSLSSKPRAVRESLLERGS